MIGRVRIDHHPADGILHPAGVERRFRVTTMLMCVMGMMVLMSLVRMSFDGPITGHGSPRNPAEEWILGPAMVARSRVKACLFAHAHGRFLVTTIMGVTGLWPAILADTGATVLVTAIAVRLLGAGRGA
jgi:hypothetical protein